MSHSNKLREPRSRIHARNPVGATQHGPVPWRRGDSVRLGVGEGVRGYASRATAVRGSARTRARQRARRASLEGRGERSVPAANKRRSVRSHDRWGNWPANRMASSGRTRTRRPRRSCRQRWRSARDRNGCASGQRNFATRRPPTWPTGRRSSQHQAAAPDGAGATCCRCALLSSPWSPADRSTSGLRSTPCYVALLHESSRFRCGAPLGGAGTVARRRRTGRLRALGFALRPRP